MSDITIALLAWLIVVNLSLLFYQVNRIKIARAQRHKHDNVIVLNYHTRTAEILKKLVAVKEDRV